MTKEQLCEMLKENLEVRTGSDREWNGSSFSESVTIEILFDGELISKMRIPHE